MKHILKYLFFLVLGIMIYILYNSVDRFSVGGVGWSALKLGKEKDSTDPLDYDFYYNPNYDREDIRREFHDRQHFIYDDIPDHGTIIIPITYDTIDNQNFGPQTFNYYSGRNSGFPSQIRPNVPGSGIGGLGFADQPPGGGGGMSGGNMLPLLPSFFRERDNDGECAAKHQKKIYTKMINLYSYLDLRDLDLNGATYSIYSLECPYKTSIQEKEADFHFFIAIRDQTTGHIITIGYGVEVELEYGPHSITQSRLSCASTDDSRGAYTSLDTYTSDFIVRHNLQGLFPDEDYNKLALSNISEFEKMIFKAYNELTTEETRLLTILGLDIDFWNLSYYENVIISEADSIDDQNKFLRDYMAQYSIFNKEWDRLSSDEKDAIRILTHGLINSKNWNTRKYEISHPYTNGCKIRQVVTWTSLSSNQILFLDKMKQIANPISRHVNDLGLQIGFRTFQPHDTGSSTRNELDWIIGNNFNNPSICATQCTNTNDYFSCLEGSILFHLLNCDGNDGQSIIDDLTEYTEEVPESESESESESEEECDRR